jgi:hypothetical protein
MKLYKNARYIQLYDSEKRHMCGSDEHVHFDQRFSNENGLNHCAKRIVAQAVAYTRGMAGSVGNPAMQARYIKPRACYAAVMVNEKPETDLRWLGNPLYPQPQPKKE